MVPTEVGKTAVALCLPRLEQAGGLGRPAKCTALQAARYRQLAAYLAGADPKDRFAAHIWVDPRQ